jgi:hypothetical protein
MVFSPVFTSLNGLWWDRMFASLSDLFLTMRIYNIYSSFKIKINRALRLLLNIVKTNTAKCKSFRGSRFISALSYQHARRSCCQVIEIDGL